MVINADDDKASTTSRAGGPAPRTDRPDLCDLIVKQLAMAVISQAHTL
jgi:hypothetical protein